MPGIADHIEEERPAIELAVNRVLLADRGDHVVDHVLRDVVVPWLDDIGRLHRRHFDEGRLADIDVPGAFLLLRLGDEALDAEAFDRRDLVVDAGEFLVHLRNAGMKVLDPLIEGRRQWTVLREGRTDAVLGNRADTRGAESCGHAAHEERRAGRYFRATAAHATPAEGSFPLLCVWSFFTPGLIYFSSGCPSKAKRSFLCIFDAPATAPCRRLIFVIAGQVSHALHVLPQRPLDRAERLDYQII